MLGCLNGRQGVAIQLLRCFECVVFQTAESDIYLSIPLFCYEQHIPRRLHTSPATHITMFMADWQKKSCGTHTNSVHTELLSFQGPCTPFLNRGDASIFCFSFFKPH